MALASQLVLAGCPGEIASIVSAACYDQRRLSSRFYGPPRVTESQARESVEAWLRDHPTVGEYAPASEDALDELIKSIF